VVSTLCSPVGLTADDLDVSELTIDEVLGFGIARQISVRGALELLAATYAFEAIESDHQLKFKKRGRPPSRVITEDDLAPLSDRETFRETRAQEVDLPRLEAYVDGRVDAEQEAAIRDHVASCIACRAEAELIGEVETRMRAAFAAETPSDAFRQRVDAILSPNHRAGAPRSQLRGSWRAAVAAAVVLLAVVGAILSGLGIYPSGTSQAGVVTASIEELRTFIDSRRPFDIVSQDPLVLRRWFEGKVDFTPPTPPMLSDLDLAGGRLCFFLDRRIAAYMYVADGRVISLYVMRGAGLGTPGGEPTRLAGKQVVVAELAEFHGAFWRSDELAFALIADLPRNHLLDVANRLIQAV
jgi:anti-sigma factor RsiW